MTTPAAPAVDFDRNRIGPGELIAGISGFVLLVSLWLNWYGIDIGGGALLKNLNVSVSVNAWESFGLIDIILFLAALIAIGVAVLKGMGRLPQMPYPPALIITSAGGIALLLILFRTISPPADGLSRKFGLFVGLISAIGVVYGGWRSMQETGARFPTTGGGAAAPTAPMASPPPPPPPPAAPAAPDPVPGTNAPQTPPGLAGEPPAGEGTRPPGV
jgi:hypothetical protein